MPNIPLYSTNIQPAEALNMPEVHAATQGFQAIGKLGSQLQDRAVQMMEEQAIIKSEEALRKAQDEEREFLLNKEKGEMVKQGAEAYGSQERSTAFYSETESKYSEGLSQREQELFKKNWAQRRTSGMNQTAGHEAQQHQAAKIAVVKGVNANLEAGINDGTIDANSLDAEIDRAKVAIRDLHKGVDTTALEKSVEQQATTAYLQRLAINDPVGFDREIALRGSKIPPATVEKLTKEKDAKEYEELFDAHRADLRADFGDDLEAKLKGIESLTADDKMKNALRQDAKAEYATAKTLENDQKKKLGDQEENKIVDVFSQRNYQAVRSMATKAQYMTPEKRAHWIAMADALSDKEIKQGLKAEAESDAEVLMNTEHLIYENADHMEYDDIANLVSEGYLNEKDGTKMMGLLRSNKKEKDPKVESVMKQINEDEKKGRFKQSWFGAAEKRAENRAGASYARSKVIEFKQMYPDKDVQEFYNKLVEERDVEKMKSAFNSLKQQAGKPTGIYAPPENKQQQSLQKFYYWMKGLNKPKISEQEQTF